MNLRAIKDWIKSLKIVFLYREKKMIKRRYMPLKEQLGGCGKNTFIEYPAYFDTPENIYLEEDVKIRNIARFVNSPNERIIIKKYTVVGPDCMIISNSHQKTVGVPQFLLGTSHVHDKAIDTIVEEDVWIGARVTILPGANIGRGSIVGAASLVTKPIPPYSVVAGSPARIIGKVFEKEDIKKHESILYPPEKRLSDTELDTLFAQNHYNTLRTFGNNQPLTEQEQSQVDALKGPWRFIGWKILLFLMTFASTSCQSSTPEDSDAAYRNQDNTFNYSTLYDGLADDQTDLYKISDYPSNASDLRILVIGNSFSEDATSTYLNQMIQHTDSIANHVAVYELAKGNASFDTWIDTYFSNEPLQAERKAGRITMNNQGTLPTLLNQAWNIIVIQQRSSDAFKWDTFQKLPLLLNILTNYGTRNLCIAYQLVWAHSASEIPYVIDGNVACCQKMEKRYGIHQIIPTGTAIQLARQTTLNDPLYLTRDNWHLSYGMGRYIASCVWYETLIAPRFHTTVAGNPIQPDGNYSPADVLLAQDCARKAAKDPFNWKW